MPLIQVTSGRRYSPDVKRRLLEEISRVAHEVTGTPMAGVRVWVVELPEDNLMIAGQTIAEVAASPADAGALLAEHNADQDAANATADTESSAEATQRNEHA